MLSGQFSSSRFPSFRNGGISALFGILFAAAAIGVISPGARAETSVEINGFSGSSFALAAFEAFTESRTSPLGAYQFTANTNHGGVGRKDGKVTLRLPAEAGMFGSMFLDHVFEQPVDLSAMDYIGVELTHSQPDNPIERIIVFLENGDSLEIFNSTLEPFLPAQKKFPIYNLKNRYSSFRLHPSRVTGLHVSITAASPGPGASVVVDAIRVATIAPKPPLSLGITLGGFRDLVVTTSRPLGSNELYRLEASHDLINWFDKGQNTRGSRGTPVFEKYFNDARFYRMSYYNHVDVSAP